MLHRFAPADLERLTLGPEVEGLVRGAKPMIRLLGRSSNLNRIQMEVADSQGSYRPRTLDGGYHSKWRSKSALGAGGMVARWADYYGSDFGDVLTGNVLSEKGSWN